MKSILCKECGDAVANSNNVLARHVRSAHSMDWVEYVVKHEMGGTWPTCECGCGEQLTWRKGGFGRFVKGHDNQGDQNPMAVKKAVKVEAIKQIQETEPGDGWMPNPWTGNEEHISEGIERDFFMHCVEKDDPITREHGLKVGWEDTSGKLHFYRPAFRHVKKPIIFDLGGFSDPEGPRRLGSIREWCDQHGMTMLSLAQDGSTGQLSVVGWHKPKEKK